MESKPKIIGKNLTIPAKVKKRIRETAQGWEGRIEIHSNRNNSIDRTNLKYQIKENHEVWRHKKRISSAEITQVDPSVGAIQQDYLTRSAIPCNDYRQLE